MMSAAAAKKWAIYIGIALFIVVMIARKMEVGPFFPKRPPSMPRNTIWINAPLLPFAAAHGWWLGCEMQDVSSDRCVLIGHNDRFSGGDGQNSLLSEEIYLSCKTLHSLKTDDIVLKQPPSSINMWINKTDATQKWLGMAPAAFLQNGDVLVPATETRECPKFLEANSMSAHSK
jgi:hypothetical protein